MVGAAGDEARAVALGAAAHGLVEGLRDAASVVLEDAPVHHHFDLPRLQAGAPLRPVHNHRQLPPALLL